MPDSKRSRAASGSGFLGLSGRRKPKTPTTEATSANDLLTELTTQHQKIAAHALRFQIGEIVAQARALLNFLHESTGALEWRDYVRDCLLSATEATQTFADRSPHLTEPTDPAVLHFHQFLTALTQTLSNLHGKLTAESPTITTGLDAYRTTLRHIAQAYRGDSRPE